VASEPPNDRMNKVYCDVAEKDYVLLKANMCMLRSSKTPFPCPE
jgi:hypothetical protein